MFRPLALAFLLLPMALICGVTCIFGQTSSDIAPTKWEKYALPGQKATVLLPKLPTANTRSNNCTGEKKSDYGAYSDGVAYVVTTINKIDTSMRCSNPKKFDENSFTDRVFELQVRYREAQASDAEFGSKKWVKLKTKSTTFFLHNDFAEKRWFEFSVTGADESKAEVKSFLASLDLDEKSKGIVIGEGSEFVIGDDQPKETPVVLTLATDGPTGPLEGVGSGAEAPKEMPVVKMDGTFKSLAIVLRPIPNYVPAGRRERSSGEVKLRVTFLNNGRIGPITIVSGVTNGFNEQAIAAAKKMLFVPAKKDDTFVSVAKIVIYSFRVY